MNTKHNGWAIYRSTHQTWLDMKQRCYNPKCRNYKNYGARGILVCERWIDSFKNFLSDMGERPSGMTLERQNNDGNYEPGNCAWATRKEQRNNQRSCHNIEFRGVTKTIRAWAASLRIHETTLHSRLKRGWPIDQALSFPRVHHRPAAMQKEKP